MKLLTLLFLSIVVLTTARLDRISNVRAWYAYKAQFGKTYSSSEQEKVSRENFYQNKQEVTLHNLAYARGEVTYKKTLNQFSDRSDAEVIGTLAGLKEGPVSNENKLGATQASTTTLPSQYNCCSGNWTVKNQGNCGSCWAFSTIGSIEAANYQKTGELLDLSEQQLVDCVYNRTGCNGGWMPTAYKYLANNSGTCDESDYPYTATYGTCQAANMPRSIQLNSGTSYYQVASDDTSLKNTLMNSGPLAVAVDASDWSKYKSGVYQNTTRTWQLNHAVILCGWNTTSNGLAYWIIRNSWGASWGLSGYIWVSAQRSGNSTTTLGGFYTNYCFYPN